MGEIAEAQVINDCIGVEKTRKFTSLKNQRCIRITWCDGHKVDECFSDISIQILSIEPNNVIESDKTGTVTVTVATVVWWLTLAHCKSVSCYVCAEQLIDTLICVAFAVFVFVLVY